MIKKVLWFVIALLPLGIVFAQSSTDPMNLPKITQYVTDYSHVLDQSSLKELSSLWEVYNSKTTNQLVTVLIPTTNGNVLFDIAAKIFKDNEIGQVSKNNGLLLVISTDEKKIRIAVGYWLEWVMPDALASRIIEENIRPLVNSGDFAGAIQKFYEKSIEIIDTNQSAWAANSSEEFTSLPKNQNIFWIIGIVLWYILASLIKSKSLKKKASKTYILILLIGCVVFLVIWLSAFILIGLLAWLVFGFTWFLPGGRGWFGWGFWGGGWFGWGGWSSWGGGAGD